jgi:hypothetical protein
MPPVTLRSSRSFLLPVLTILPILGTLGVLSAALGSFTPAEARGTPSRAPLPRLNWVERVENGTLYFQGGIPSLQTPLQDLNLLGILESSGAPERDPKALFLLASAKTCPGCGQDRAIYLQRLSGGKPVQFTHPGRIVDPKSGAVTLDSRAFYGRCLGGRGEVYVAFQKERIERRKKRARIENSVFIAEPTAELVREELLHKGFPSLSGVIQRVRQGSCWEVPSRHRPQSGPIVSLKVSPDDEEDDDDGVETPGEEGAKPASEVKP